MTNPLATYIETCIPRRAREPSAGKRRLSCWVKSIGALSSVGLERLPYKQEVAGSNPAAPIEVNTYMA